MIDYAEIYNEEIDESMTRLSVRPEELQQFLKEQRDFVSIHFGEGRLNPSTLAGIMRSFIKFKGQQLSIA